MPDAPEAEEFDEMEAENAAVMPFKKWVVHSAQVRSKLKVPHDWMPWSDVSELHGIPNTSRRAIELLNIGYIIVLKEAQRQATLKRNPKPYRPELLSRGFFADISQAVQRKPFGPLSTLHTNSWWYSYEHDIVLPGLVHVALNGFPSNLEWGVFGDTPQQQGCAARRLMGESFSLPVAATVVMAAFMTHGAPWWGNCPASP